MKETYSQRWSTAEPTGVIIGVLALSCRSVYVRISAAIVWERASQLFRRQRDASLAHLTPDEIAMHPRGHALLEAP